MTRDWKEVTMGERTPENPTRDPPPSGRRAAAPPSGRRAAAPPSGHRAAAASSMAKGSMDVDPLGHRDRRATAASSTKHEIGNRLHDLSEILGDLVKEHLGHRDQCAAAGGLFVGVDLKSKHTTETLSEDFSKFMLEISKESMGANFDSNVSDFIDQLLEKTDSTGGIENFAVVVLDGSAKDVLGSYSRAIVKCRLWNQLRGSCFDISPVIDSDSEMLLYSTSPHSSFHFIIVYCNRAIDLVFDGKEAWLKAVLKDGDGSFQYPPARLGDEPYLPSRKCRVLAFEGKYHNTAPFNDPGSIKIGLHNLRVAFEETHASDGSGATDKLKLSLGTFVVFFGEATKFHRAFKACISSLLSEEDTETLTLKYFDPDLGKLVRCWGKLSAILMRIMFNATMRAAQTCLKMEKLQEGTAADLNAQRTRFLSVLVDQKVLMNQENDELKWLGLASITRLQDVLDNVCIFTHTSMIPHSDAKKYFTSLSGGGMPVFAPVAPCNVDEDEDSWASHFRMKCHEVDRMIFRKPSLPFDPEASKRWPHNGCPRAENEFVLDFFARNKTAVFQPAAWLSDPEVTKRHCGLNLLDLVLRPGTHNSFEECGTTVRWGPASASTATELKRNMPGGMLAALLKRGLNLLKIK